MKCPRCQQENPSHVKFCLECGGSFISKGPSAGSYHELQRALAEALEQQTATEEILRVISRSPTHLQPVLDTIARSAVRVCGASDALVAIREGDESVTAAHYGDQEVVALGQRRPIIRGLVLGRALLEARPVQVEDITQTDEFPEGRAIAVRFGHRTVMAVPLLRDGVAIGGIIMRRSEVERFSDKQIALLQTFADQAVIAIENVRLFNETKAALEQQTATSEILRVISQSPTDVQPVFDAIVRSASHLCGGEYAIVTRYDGEFLRLAAQYNARPGLANVTERFFPRRPGRDLPSGRAILDRAAAHIPDTAEDRDLGPDVAGIAGSYLSVPMVRDDVPVGAIGVSRATVGRFAPEQIALLQTFADQAVIAIENVRLFKELQEKNHALTVAHAQVTEALERQTATADVLGIIAKSPTALQPVLDAIATSAARLCRAYDATLLRLDGDTLHLVAHHGPIPSAAVLPVRGTVGGRCAVEREAVHVLDLQAEVEAFPEASAFARQFGFRTILTVPLLREDQTIGVLQLRRTEVAVFTEQQVTLLRTFADQAVIAIENVRLFTELQEKNRALTEAHAQVTEAFERQTATSEILGIISRSPTDVQPVFDTIVRSATKLCDGLFGALVRFDGELVHFVAQHNFPPAALDEVRRIWPTRPSRISGAGRAILDRAVVQIPDIELDSEYGLQQLSRTVGHRSSIYVPMLRDSLPIGVIVVARREVGRFADNQVELLKTFADQAVIAIENVRLFTELQSRNRELTEALEQQTATSEILRVIAASSTDVQPVFDTIVRSARRLCNASDASLVRFDGELMHLAATTAVEPGRNAALRSQFPARPTRTLALCRAIVDRVVVHIPDVAEDPEYPQDHARRVGLASILVVPMLREGTAIGSVGVSRTVPEAFSDTQVALLKTFADQAVIAIENSRLLTELQTRTHALTRSVEQLTALGEVGRAVSSTLDLETVLTTIVSRAVELSGLDGGVVFEYEDRAEEFVQRVATETGQALAEARRTTRIRKGEGVLGRTAITLEPVQVPDITAPGAYEGRLREVLIGSGIRAILAVPMVYERRLIGCLGVTRNQPGDFSNETIELLRTFATQSALAIQNARLFHEIEVKSRELEAASQHKSEFLANMSHELRTPLNAIIGFSEVLGERLFGDLNEKQEEYLRDIHASGQHLLSLINDILDLSKIEAGRMELELTDFHLPAALDNALTLIRERAGRRGIALHMTTDERLEYVRADERKIKQVLLNLLSNAIKFTPEGGRIEVRAKQQVDGSVEIVVSDTGVGIAPEDQEAIFEEFRQVGTAAKKVEGTGLGLALSRSFIELHGGRIWVQSEPGAGSTFTFTLPRGPA